MNVQLFHYRFGRFPVMMLTTTAHLLFALLAAYAPGYWSFSWLRFAVWFCAHCAYLCGFVIRE